MTTRRRTICCILSAALLSSCAAVGPEPRHRVVRVKALASPGLRERNPRWPEEVRGLVEAASDYYEREFGIRLITESAAAWPGEPVASTLELLSRLKREFSPRKSAGRYDIVIAFTAEAGSRYFRSGRPRVDRIGNCREGLGRYVVAPVTEPFRYTGIRDEPKYDVAVLIHELGHVFGAEHVDDPSSVMHERFEYRSEFDMKNRNVILKNRECPFADE
ncbi:MAG TPA: M12 family metallo-peptidase [candidate division Zixibacteria bacterium]|nr:M12 family metallo-peptidase [candidate division Zixibacteria bacterium]